MKCEMCVKNILTWQINIYTLKIYSHTIHSDIFYFILFFFFFLFYFSFKKNASHDYLSFLSHDPVSCYSKFGKPLV